MAENLLFDSTEHTLSVLVKNLEKRWGLTLVSFLPESARRQAGQLQVQAATMLGQADDPLREIRPYVEFYEHQQFHCTHFTLTRSDPAGPVQARTFVKENVDLYDLFSSIEQVTSQINPIRIRMDHLTISPDGHIVLLGECADQESVDSRYELLDGLNHSLGQKFNISQRSWDADKSKFHQLHCSLGFVKRVPPQGYVAFAKVFSEFMFDPIVDTLADVTLVHHKYRSLIFPQQGSVAFRFGLPEKLAPDEFSRALGLE